MASYQSPSARTTRRVSWGRGCAAQLANLTSAFSLGLPTACLDHAVAPNYLLCYSIPPPLTLHPLPRFPSLTLNTFLSSKPKNPLPIGILTWTIPGPLGSTKPNRTRHLPSTTSPPPGFPALSFTSPVNGRDAHFMNTQVNRSIRWCSV